MACTYIWIFIIFFISLFPSSRMHQDVRAQYVRAYTDMSLANDTTDNFTSSSRERCMFLCDPDEIPLLVQFNRRTGLFRCYNDYPLAPSLVSEYGSDLYVVSGLEECAMAASHGYGYNRTSHFCYKLHSDLQKMGDAHNQCKLEGGVLAKVDTDEKFALIIELFGNDGPTEYYIGAKLSNGQWTWLADSSLMRDISIVGSGTCMVIDRQTRTFNPSDCDQERRPYVCDIPLE